MFCRLIMFCIIVSFVSCASQSEMTHRSGHTDPIGNTASWNR